MHRCARSASTRPGRSSTPRPGSGGVGFYDESHVRRLEGIARLQERGYSIAAIRDLFDAWEQGAGLRDVLGVDDAIGLPADEAPIAISRDQLAELLPGIAESDRLLARACKLRLLVADGDGYLARSPALVQLVADAVAAGLSPTAALDLAEAVTARRTRSAGRGRRRWPTGVDSGRGRRSHSCVEAGCCWPARSRPTPSTGSATTSSTTASTRPELADLVAGIRIGTIATPPNTTANTDRKATR